MNDANALSAIFVGRVRAAGEEGRLNDVGLDG